MSVEKPFFSIIVPVYNASKYLKSCIESVLNQSFSDFELILIDDGSIDKSLEICLSYSSRYDKVVVKHKTNGGQLSARIEGIKLSKGDYCVFLDADDYYDKNALLTVYESLKTTNIDCLIFGYNIVGSNGVVGHTKAFFPSNLSLLFELLTDSSFNSMCRKAVKKDLLLQDLPSLTDFFNIRRGEDAVQSFFLYKRTNRIEIINNCIYNYRVNDESVTHSISLDSYKDVFTIRSFIYDDVVQNSSLDQIEIKKYKSFMLSIFCHEARLILKSKFPLEKRLKTIREMKKTYFYYVSKTAKTKKFRDFITLVFIRML